MRNAIKYVRRSGRPNGGVRVLKIQYWKTWDQTCKTRLEDAWLEMKHLENDGNKLCENESQICAIH